jgi:ATP-dependent DNA ligase
MPGAIVFKRCRLVTIAFIFEAVAKLPVRSCLIDGEAIVYDQNELAVFDLIRCGALASAVLCAFDLLELDGLDLRKRMVLHGNE